MNKKLIRLTESDLHNIVKKSVNRILRESEGLNAKQWLSSYKKSNGVYPDTLYQYTDPDFMKNKNKASLDYKLERLKKGYDDYKLAMINHEGDEAEAFPDLKDAQNKASWKAIDDEYGTPNGNDSTAFRDDTNYDRHVGNDLAYYANNNVYESYLHRIVKESVNRILKEHDMYALGRVSGRALERSADMARDMGRKGIQPSSEVSKMKNQDRIAHNANRLHNKILGLNPDKEFGHINDEDFGNGMRDGAIDHKFRKRG